MSKWMLVRPLMSIDRARAKPAIGIKGVQMYAMYIKGLPCLKKMRINALARQAAIEISNGMKVGLRNSVDITSLALLSSPIEKT